jgi:hypothetical protein
MYSFYTDTLFKKPNFWVLFCANVVFVKTEVFRWFPFLRNCRKAYLICLKPNHSISWITCTVIAVVVSPRVGERLLALHRVDAGHLHIQPRRSPHRYSSTHTIGVKYGVRSPKFIWAPVYSCTHWLRPCNSPPPPAFGLIYEGAIGQAR